MKEAEWFANADPGPMLQFLRDKVSARKLRLFACAYTRRLFHLLPDPWAQNLVEVAERFADGLVTREELKTASDVLRAKMGPPGGAIYASVAAQSTTFLVTHKGYHDIILRGQCFAAFAVTKVHTDPMWGHASSDEIRNIIEVEPTEQAALLHDLLGPLPFRFPAIDSGWIRWNDGTVPKIAKSIYEERAFDRLPILADALEDAGCTSREILDHCRRPAEHVRGCWLVDLLLNKW